MKPPIKIAVICFGAALLITGCGRDTKHNFLISDAMNSPLARETLDPDIKVEFAKGNGDILRKGLVSNKKTNAANKSDEDACIRAFISAVKQFQQSARDAGATKVINLISYYRKSPFSSTTQYECHAGGVIAGVALKGDLAR